MIKKLLVVDPYKRLNADGILKHPWIVGDVTPRKNLPTVSAKIKEFNARRRLKVSFCVFDFVLTIFLKRAQLLVLINVKWRGLIKSENN